jgi:hypothetical protein
MAIRPTFLHEIFLGHFRRGEGTRNELFVK